MMTEDAIALAQSQHRRKRLMIKIGIFLLILILIPIVYVLVYAAKFYPKIKNGELTSYNQVKISRVIAKGAATSTSGMSAEDFATLVPTSTVPESGSKDAKLTIVEFIDYQCPYSQEMYLPIQQMLKTYPDQVRLIVRDFPVTDLHADARNAAHAAHCALEQGQSAYWRFQELMFGDQQGLSLDGLRNKANLAKINVARFDECMSAHTYDLQIDQDIEYAKRIGVEGTPTFFLNGVKVEGSMAEDQWKSVIKSAFEQL